MLRVLVVLLSVICVVFAAPSSGSVDSNPKKNSNVPGCYIEELDQVIPFGQSAPARNSCMEYTCHENSISAKTCASEYALPPYQLFEDKTKLYPDCCPYYKIPQ